jgi:hypothetical protein
VGEHLLCKQGVVGSIPSASTSAVAQGAVGRLVRMGKDTGSKASWTMPRGLPAPAGGFALFDMVKRVLTL